MKNLFILEIIIMASLFNLFGCSKKDKPYDTADVYEGLRNHLFSVDPTTIGIERNTSHFVVWGVLMETGYPEAIVTLKALGDGSVSLYFSNGGGIIGLGEHEQPKLIAKQLIDLSQNFVDKLSETQNYPLPKKGYTRFYLLTFSGVFTTEIQEDILGNGKHELSPLFFKADDLITAIRIAQESTDSN